MWPSRGRTNLYTTDNLQYVRSLAKTLKGLEVVAHVTAMTELAVVDAQLHKQVKWVNRSTVLQCRLKSRLQKP